MFCSPTLTADEFSKVHNGLCDLRLALESLEDVLAPDIYKRLLSAQTNISEGLTSAYIQDDIAFSTKNNHYGAVAADLGLKSVWSLYEVEDLSAPHPYGKVDAVIYDSHWGNKPVSCKVNGNTWAALYVAANACIRDSGDDHHTFIEAFRKEERDGKQVLVLSTGS